MNLKKEKDIILIVYKNETMIKKITDILGEDSFSYITAKSAIEALSKISFQMPNIIISESDLEHDTGSSFCSKIRRSIKTKLLPFIVISDSDNNDERIKSIEEGVDAHLVFPEQSKELKAHVVNRIQHFNEFYLLSITDELTSLFNRREFIKEFNTIIARDPEITMSIAMVDIDFFKKVNDLHGHQTGDYVLMKFAELLKNTASENFFPTRFGGEEFAVLLPNVTSADAKAVFERLNEVLHNVSFSGNKSSSFTIGFSCGIAEYPGTNRNLSVLLSRADQALYSAKKDGRGRTYIFEPHMSHNDRFWEFFSKTTNYFVDSENNDSVTNLPLLPKILEHFCEFQDEINSVGIININITPLFNFRKRYSITNFDNAIQNVKFIIERVCLKYYASDTYITVSRFLDYGFTVLFPSLFDFTLNKEKCSELFNDIVAEIDRKLMNYPLNMEYAHGTIYYKNMEAKSILAEIIEIAKTRTLLYDKKSYIHELTNSKSELKSILSKHYASALFNSCKENDSLLYLTPESSQGNHIELDVFMDYLIHTVEDLNTLMKYIVCLAGTRKCMIPWSKRFSLDKYIEIAKSLEATGSTIYITIHEADLRPLVMDKDHSFTLPKKIPDNVALGISNCYISPEFLRIITLHNFDLVYFSKYLFKNFHYYKNRIKLVNGIKLFLEQLQIPTFVAEVDKEEEYHFIKGLHIDYISGKYIP